MKTVLIIEDEEALARLYQKSVTDPNVRFIIARDGLEGLAIAKKEKPALIVTDIMMPRMNGIQVLETVKSDPVLKNTPVVMLSNLNSEDDVKKAREKGAADFWSKRDNAPSMIVAKILKMLG